MLNFIGRWYRDKFSDPQAVTLVFILLAFSGLIYFAGNILAPLLVALVLAFLLEWPVAQMSRIGIGRTAGASFMLLLFGGFTLLMLLGVLPSVWEQALALLHEFPVMLDKGLGLLQELENNYPQYVSSEQIIALKGELNRLMDPQYLLDLGRQIVNFSASLLVLMVYAILVPLLVFFFLKDKDVLIDGSKRFFPSNRQLAAKVWQEVEQQIFNYIRGKVIEIVIVGTASYLFFAFMDLRYAALLGVLTGLSVLVPYVGATLVTLPIVLVGFFQWGFSAEFGYLMLGYGIIQALDGNVLVPVLFADAVDQHPVVIIMAVLVFGGLWGFWGVFFAIPLASLVKAVLNAWPSSDTEKIAMTMNIEDTESSDSPSVAR